MAKLVYSMITSLDGYAAAAEGDLGTGAEDQEVHTFIGGVRGGAGSPAGRGPRGGEGDGSQEGGGEFVAGLGGVG